MARTKGSDELYRLIHALTAEEKSYFKKFTKRHSDRGGKSLELFDAINLQNEFEESSLKSKFKNYTVMKVYLFDSILDSLFLSDSGKSIEVELVRKWLHTRYLNMKGLDDKLIQFVSQGTKTAQEHEIFWLEDRFLRMKHKFGHHRWPVFERKEKTELFFNDLEFVKDRQDNIDKLLAIERDLFNVYYDGNLENKYDEQQVNSLYRKYLKDKGKITTVTGKRKEATILGLYYSFTGNTRLHLQVLIDSYNYEKQLYRQKHPMGGWAEYVASIRYLMLFYLNSRQAEKVFSLNEEMKSLTPRFITQKADNELYYILYQLYAYWHSGKHKAGAAFIAANFPRQLVQDYSKMFRTHVLNIYSYRLLFEIADKNYKGAFITMSDLEMLEIKKYAPHYYKSCELIRILLQVELKEYALLPSMISNMLRRAKLTPVEDKMLRVMKRMNDVNRKEIFKKLLELLPKGEGEIVLLSTLRVRSWLQAMISDKPVWDFIKANNEQ